MFARKEGIVYMYVAYGSFGDAGHMYYIGRSGASKFLQCGPDQVDRRDCIGARGLNRASRVLLWARSEYLEDTFATLRSAVVGWYVPGFLRDAAGSGASGGTQSKRPETTQHHMLGSQWFSCENMGPEEFGEWARGVCATIESHNEGIASFALKDAKGAKGAKKGPNSAQGRM